MVGSPFAVEFRLYFHSLGSGTMEWTDLLTMDLPGSANGSWRRGPSGCPVVILRQYFLLAIVISHTACGNTTSRSPIGSSSERRSCTWTSACTTPARTAPSTSTWCSTPTSSVRMFADVRSQGWMVSRSLIELDRVLKVLLVQLLPSPRLTRSVGRSSHSMNGQTGQYSGHIWRSRGQ